MGRDFRIRDPSIRKQIKITDLSVGINGVQVPLTKMFTRADTPERLEMRNTLVNSLLRLIKLLENTLSENGYSGKIMSPHNTITTVEAKEYDAQYYVYKSGDRVRLLPRFPKGDERRVRIKQVYNRGDHAIIITADSVFRVDKTIWTPLVEDRTKRYDRWKKKKQDPDSIIGEEE